MARNWLISGIVVLGLAVVPAFAAFGGNGSPSPATSNTAALIPPTIAGSAAQKLALAPPQRDLALADEAPPATAPPTDAPVVTEAPAEAALPPTMEVREGDTLLALAEWFGLSPFEIAAYNGFSADDYLQIGQVLAIPVDPAAFVLPPDPQAYVAADVEAEVYVEPDPAPAAVAEPAPPPPPPPPAPYVPPSADDVIAAICSFPWPCEKMIRVAACESGLNPRAVNPAGYYGLFQIAGMFDGWDDPWVNARVAYEQKYLPSLARGGDGLSPWPVCRNY